MNNELFKNYVIKQVVANPKRGTSRERFAVYEQARTIGHMIQIYTERGYRTRSRQTPRSCALADLRWDLEHGFIKIYKRTLVEVTL